MTAHPDTLWTLARCGDPQTPQEQRLAASLTEWARARAGEVPTSDPTACHAAAYLRGLDDDALVQVAAGGPAPEWVARWAGPRRAELVAWMVDFDTRHRVHVYERVVHALGGHHPEAQRLARLSPEERVRVLAHLLLTFGSEAEAALALCWGAG